MNIHRTTITALMAAVACLLLVQDAAAVRIKDIASFRGVRSNQLVGYGLVVGLSGTGDQRGSDFTIQSVVNLLENLGVRVDEGNIRPKNVAAVLVTTDMPVSAKPGTKLDVTVSSLGDAESLLGGVLLMTPLQGVDGKVYALAQGPLTLGGFSVSGQAASAQKNIATVGRIPAGAIVERAVPFNFNDQDKMTISFQTADFSTVMDATRAINRAMNGPYAKAVDAGTVEMAIPPQFQGNLVPLMAVLENLDVTPDIVAKVVVDEKTGTVVVGQNVKLSRVAVAHGNLQIVIQENLNVSQPEPFSQGQTVVTPETALEVQEGNRQLMLVEGATLQELVDGLNAIGASPRDLISILRTLRAAGALHAQLEVI